MLPEPSLLKGDCAEWMLEEPRVNFAISARGAAAGLEHLGIQVEDEAELAELYGRPKGAEGPVLEEGATTCRYAQSTKSWISDPAGIAWEAFPTTGGHTTYGDSALFKRSEDGEVTACCGPKPDFTAAKAAEPAAASCCDPKATAAPMSEPAKSCC